MPRNPAWTEEEIILATELYVRANGKVLGSEHPDVIELSKFLNRLDIHPTEKRGENFRRPSAVEMKLANIRGADPTRSGGFTHGSKLDAYFWEKLGANETELRRRASQIRLQAITK